VGIRPGMACTFALTALALACHGGSGGGDEPTPVQIRFVPEAAPPLAPGTVALVESGFTPSSFGGRVIVAVVLTEATGVFGADFDLVYDSFHFDFVSATEGRFLSENGIAGTQLVVAREPGASTERLVVGLYRTGAGAADLTAAGEQTLMSLEFRARRRNVLDAPVTFDATIRPPRVVSKDGTTVVAEPEFKAGSLRIEIAQ